MHPISRYKYNIAIKHFFKTWPFLLTKFLIEYLFKFLVLILVYSICRHDLTKSIEAKFPISLGSVYIIKP